MSPRLAKRLVEPTHWTCPHGARTRPESVLTFGPEVADVCARANFEPDAQQELGLDLIFAIRPDGSPASFETCVICCRQNLKTGLFKQAAIGWLFVTEQRLVVWSAHEMSTTDEAQRDLAALFLDAPFLRRRMMRNDNDGVYYANGEERIELASGQRIMFKARTKNGGRGLAAPKLILDEAFALTPSMMGSLLPLMTAQTDPQVVYGSSAGKADSEVLLDIRERGRNGISPRMAYIEWLSERESCAQDGCTHPKDAEARGLDCALDREHLIVEANPTISTGRIRLETIRNLRQALPPEEFMRECLGWWDETGPTLEVIPVPVWSALAADAPPPDGTKPAALAVDMSHDRVVAITGLWHTDRGGHVELLAMDVTTDTAGVVAWLFERAGHRIPVVIDALSPAAQLVPALKARRMRVIVTNDRDMAKACGAFYADVLEGKLSHNGEPAFVEAVRGARKRDIGGAGGWGWDRKDPSRNIAPLVSATLAHYGAALTDKPTRRGRAATDTRRAVML